jgi:hypothetical protein
MSRASSAARGTCTDGSKPYRAARTGWMRSSTPWSSIARRTWCAPSRNQAESAFRINARSSGTTPRGPRAMTPSDATHLTPGLSSSIAATRPLTAAGLAISVSALAASQRTLQSRADNASVSAALPLTVGAGSIRITAGTHGGYMEDTEVK